MKPFSFGTFEMAIITLVLVGLKVLVDPGIPWPVVLSPIWLPVAGILLLILAPFALSLIILVAIILVFPLFLLWELVSGLWNGGAK